MSAAPPPVIFEVSIAVTGEMRWCMRAKGVFDDWLMRETESGQERPIDELPAADMAMQTPDVADLRLTWIELPAVNAWDAVQRAAAIVEEVLPELLRTRSVKAEARMQNPDADLRRPVGA
jgi:hypothetical protein